MADEKQESVIDMDVPAQETQKEEPKKAEEKKTEQKQKQAIQINVSFNTLILIFAIVSIALALFSGFFRIVGAGAVVYSVFKCLNLIALCATMAFYLVDFIKNKNFSVNPAFICMILAIFVTALQ